MKITLRVIGSKLPPLVGEGSTLRLGRDPECEFSLGEKFDSVSWRHAKIVLSPNGAVVTDLESTNGTFVNDRRVQGTVMLKKGDHLRLGNGGPTLEVASLDLTPTAASARKKLELPETEPYRPSDEPTKAPATNILKQPRGLAIGVGTAAAGLMVVFLAIQAVQILSKPPEGPPQGEAPSTQPTPVAFSNGPATTPVATPPRPSGGTTQQPPIGTHASLQDQAMALLKEHCGKCHGPQLAKPKGGFGHIDSLEKMVSGEQLVKGAPEKSPLYDRLSRPADDDELMPPEKEGGPLPADKLALIKRWIASLGSEVASNTTATPNRQLPPPPPPPAAPASGIEAEARVFLKKYCYDCHGVQKKDAVLNVFDRDILLAPRDGKLPYVTPNDPDKSAMWVELAVKKSMPTKEPKPSDAEKETLRNWIMAGAPLTTSAVARTFITEKDVLEAIHRDQTQTPTSNWPYYRYFTLVNLHNSRDVSDADMALYRAALSKLVNSLSRKARIVLPEAIDQARTIYRIDTRQLDWDRNNLWQEIVSMYPYALRHDRSRDEGLRRVAEDVRNNSNSLVPAVRADWFIATASRPPLYHTLLRIPTNAQVLERELDVDIPVNFSRNNLKRAGFNQSGVSKQNRLLERHDSRDGYYWKSYDFKRNTPRGDLLKFPLGPFLRGNRFTEAAFQHDGGEIIYSLPNGLQAYMLVNGQDGRIDEGPTDVVDDPGALSGTTVIVNGISCMGCHKEGMIRGFKDMVRDSTSLTGNELQKVLEIFPEQAEMDRLIADDTRRFMRAVEEATRPFLPEGQQTAEPITTLAGPYLKKDLGLADVARELGMADPSALKTLIAGSQTLRSLGLGPLANDHVINRREGWERVDVVNRDRLRGCFSVYQQVAHELGLGEPTPVNRP